MTWQFLRRIIRNRAQLAEDNPYRAKSGTYWHWRCECGAHSRGGDPFKADADQNAYLHQHRKGVGHPMPEVYSTTSG